MDRPRSLLGILVILLLSMPIAARAQDDGATEASAAEEFETSKGPVVSRIAWTGVRAFEEDELEEKLVTEAQPRFEIRFWRAAKRLDDFAVQEDLERIEQAYRDIGYFETAADFRVNPLPGDRVIVEFIVDEGPRVTLTDWQLAVEPAPDDADPASDAERRRFKESLPAEVGIPFGASLYRERREALLELAAEHGFILARIEGGARIDRDAQSARVDWTLVLGPRQHFGALEIEGLSRIDEEIVRRELQFERGERFVPSLLEESERRLVGTGLFRSAAIGRPPDNPDDDDAEQGQDGSRLQSVDLRVRVAEAPARSFRASIGYGTEDGPRGEISLAWRNFGGAGRLFRTRAFASLLDAGFEASLDQPYVFGDAARFDFAVSSLRQERPGYEALVAGSTALLSFYPDREGPLRVRIGPGVEFAQILDFGIETSERIRGPRQSFVSNWFTIVRHETVDDVLDPRRGHRLELRNEIGGHPMGSDLDYHRWDLQARFYVPTGPVVFAFRADASTLDPIGAGIADVPLTRRLYAGGTNSIRGFGFQKLGPEDAGNDPIGGLTRIETGIELRIPVYGGIGLVGFVDAGDVASTPWSFHPRDLRASGGPGLRIATPVGPLRLDFGWLINRPRDSDPWRFHLSVGHAF